MFNFILKLFIVFTVFHSSHTLASLSYCEEDYELSKKFPVISVTTHSDIFSHDKGVVTVCFNSKHSNEHAALVFEARLPNDPANLSLKLIHFGAPADDCCASGFQKVIIEDEKTTLKKVYRALKTLPSTGKTCFENPLYDRYASFIVRNSDLVRVLAIVEKDQEEKVDFSYAGTKFFKDSHNCASYVAKVMHDIGIKIHFNECWVQNTKTLKERIDLYKSNDDIKVIKNNDLPKFRYQV